MSAKNKKNDDIERRRRMAQILFAILAVMLILSMVLSAIVTY
jgi:hypothetical protein